MQTALDADLDRVASSKDGNMINITVYSDAGTKRLTVDPARPVYEAIAEVFGCDLQQQVQCGLFGDMDVLEGESFEDHGVEVGGVDHCCKHAPVCSSVQQLTSGSAQFVCCVPHLPGRGEAQRKDQDAEGECQGSGG